VIKARRASEAKEILAGASGFEAKLAPPTRHPPVIIARSPLRVSLGGGGTDLPSYYREYGGFLIAAAIDKAVYVTVHRTFLSELVVRYSKIERVAAPRE